MWNEFRNAAVPPNTGNHRKERENREKSRAAAVCHERIKQVKVWIRTTTDLHISIRPHAHCAVYLGRVRSPAGVLHYRGKEQRDPVKPNGPRLLEWSQRWQLPLQASVSLCVRLSHSESEEEECTGGNASLSPHSTQRGQAKLNKCPFITQRDPISSERRCESHRSQRASVTITGWVWSRCPSLRLQNNNTCWAERS